MMKSVRVQKSHWYTWRRIYRQQRSQKKKTLVRQSGERRQMRRADPQNIRPNGEAGYEQGQPSGVPRIKRHSKTVSTHIQVSPHSKILLKFQKVVSVHKQSHDEVANQGVIRDQLYYQGHESRNGREEYKPRPLSSVSIERYIQALIQPLYVDVQQIPHSHVLEVHLWYLPTKPAPLTVFCISVKHNSILPTRLG